MLAGGCTVVPLLSVVLLSVRDREIGALPWVEACAAGGVMAMALFVVIPGARLVQKRVVALSCSALAFVSALLVGSAASLLLS